LIVDSDTSVQELVSLTNLDGNQIEHRLEHGNACYIARLHGASAAYGWVAAADADIGELVLPFRLHGSNRYLWDFQTLPEWRGRGIYPLLLQAILTDQRSESHRFWIITAPENRASARGIDKAGFTRTAELAFTEGRRAGTCCD
jgi:GNAT superfamily N-acetyltransferase